jgi:integrase
VPSQPKAETLAWLVEQYQDSNEWKSFGQSTRKVRRAILDKIIALPHPRMAGRTWGECPGSQIAPQPIKELRDANLVWLPVTAPETGEDPDDVVRTNNEGSNSWLKALRAVSRWAFNDWAVNLPTNPCLGIKLYPGSVEGFHGWALQEIETYRTKYHLGTKERPAFELLLFTGQRRGDIVRLGEKLLTTDSKGRPIFSFRQEKNRLAETAATAFIPYWQKLREVVEATMRGEGGPYLPSQRGAVHEGELRDHVPRLLRHAGLRDCSAHGLRKAFVVESIRRERRPAEIMAATGHKTMKEFDRYAREYMRQNAVEPWLDDNEAEISEVA